MINNILVIVFKTVINNFIKNEDETEKVIILDAIKEAANEIILEISESEDK